MGENEGSTEERPEKKKLGRTVTVLGLVSFFTDASTEMIYPLIPIFLTSVIGAGAVFLGVIEGIAEGTASILKGFSGYISDRIKKRKALIFLGYGLSAVTKPFFAAASAVWHVLLVRFVERIGKGIRTAPRDALIAESVHENIRGKAYGFHRAMDTLGAVVGPALAFLLMWLLRGFDQRSVYRWIFLFSFIPAAVAVLLIVVAVRERYSSASSVRIKFKISALGRNYRFLLLVIIVFMLGNSSDTFLLLRAQELGLKAYFVPLLWLVFNIVYSLVSMPAGMISDRIGRKKTLIAGFLLYSLLYLGFGISNSMNYMWILIAAYGVFYGLTHGVLSAYVADMAPESFRGTAFGVYQTADGVSRLLASIIFGALWETLGPSIAFYFGSFMAFAATGILWIFCEESNRC